MTLPFLLPAKPDAPLDGFAFACGRPTATGVLRATPEDFEVEEMLPETPGGSGEHVWIKVRKRGANTEWVARQLRTAAGVRPVDVSYAGLKDRQAVCTQWFSVHLPKGIEPDWYGLSNDEFRILEATRHSRKLRRGALTGNRFRLVIRELTGDLNDLESRLENIGHMGVPNYFGEQRFGREGNNLIRAAELFAGEGGRPSRHKRGLYLSAARGWLFNQVLARRIGDGNWNQALDGEVLMLDGTHSVFRATEVDDVLRRRVAEFDIHPTGPLWGKGPSPASGAVQRLESEVLAPYAAWRRGLEHFGLEHQRRSLRLPVRDLTWLRPDDKTLVISFWLPSGGYATAAVRELVNVRS